LSKMMVCGKVFLKKLPKSNPEFTEMEAFIRSHDIKMPQWQSKALALKITYSDERVTINDVPQTIPDNLASELFGILLAFQKHQIKMRNQRDNIANKVKELCKDIPEDEIITLRQINILYEKLRNNQGPEVIIREFIFMGSVSGMDALWKPVAWLRVSPEDRRLIQKRAKKLMQRISHLNLSNSNKRKQEPGTRHGSELHFQFYLDEYLPRLRGEYSLLDEFD